MGQEKPCPIYLGECREAIEFIGGIHNAGIPTTVKQLCRARRQDWC